MPDITPLDAMGDFLARLGLHDITHCHIFCDWENKRFTIRAEHVLNQVTSDLQLIRVTRKYKVEEVLE